MPTNSAEYMKQYFQSKKYYKNNKDKFDKPSYCETCDTVIKGHKTRHDQTKHHIVLFIAY